VSRLAVAASRYCGSLYDAAHPKVAEASPLVPLSVVGGWSCGTDCSTMVTGILGAVWPVWPSGSYARCQVQDAAQPWSAVDRWLVAGIGDMDAGPLDPAAWYVAQGWRPVDKSPVLIGGLPVGGHQFILHAGRRLHASSQAGRVLWQATTLDSLRATYGAGLRVVRLR
jgi:hypothetical protein